MKLKTKFRICKGNVTLRFSTFTEFFLLFRDLSKNKISYVEFENFVNLTSIKRLDLSFNSIRQIDETAFGDIKSLEKLKLKNNLIEHIFQGSFDGLPALKLL